MLNNLSPTFCPTAPSDTANITNGSKVPPSGLRTIGDDINNHKITWAYYGGGYDAAVRVANGSTNPIDQAIAGNYCDICNFESYARSIMGNPSQRAAHIKDAINFFNDLEAGSCRRCHSSNRTAHKQASRQLQASTCSRRCWRTS